MAGHSRKGQFRNDLIDGVPGWKVRRPDFEPGNALAVKSGAFSARLVSEDAERIAEHLAELMPWLGPHHLVVLDVLCKAKARYDRADTYANDLMDEVTTTQKGETGIEAVPDRIWKLLISQENTIINACAKLGMTATDQAMLMKDASWAKALSAGRAEALASEGARLRQLRAG